MTRATLALGLLIAASSPMACITQKSVPETGTTVPIAGILELVIVNEQGWPIWGVAVFDEHGGVHVAEQGALQLVVTGPVALVAYRPGYGPSQKTIFPPGHHELTLYSVGRVNE